MTINTDITLPQPLTFQPEDWRILARHWYPVALSAEVGGAPECR